MDISLHSFILMIGLIVIGFIVWDGIKKVRAARANRLDQSFLHNDQLDVLANDELPKFDDLEIKDDLLKGGLKESSEVAPLSDTFDYGLSKPRVVKKNDTQDDQNDGFEHFSASKDEPDELSEIEEPANPSFDTSLDKPNEDKHPVEKQVPIVEKEKPKRKNKEELVAKLAKAKAQAKEQPRPSTVELVEQVEVDDKEPVPVLMESVELGQKVEPNPPTQHELVLPERIQQTLIDEPVYASQDLENISVEVTSSDHEKSDVLMDYIDEVQALPVGEQLSEREAAEEIFVINILKQDGSGLAGEALNHVFKACDMRHGEMNIFHRFEKANAQGKIQFSVVNAIEPGTFDLENIDELVTPGISLFMSLPGPEKPMEAFDAMAEVALVFARNFDATLHDDTHSDLTPQTLEHYRNRIREFTRKHLSQKK